MELKKTMIEELCQHKIPELDFYTKKFKTREQKVSLTKIDYRRQFFENLSKKFIGHVEF